MTSTPLSFSAIGTSSTICARNANATAQKTTPLTQRTLGILNGTKPHSAWNPASFQQRVQSCAHSVQFGIDVGLICHAACLVSCLLYHLAEGTSCETLQRAHGTG